MTLTTCATDPAAQFVAGKWLNAVSCWLTGGGNPTLAVVIPLFMFGSVLVSMFIVGDSPVIPAVVSIIFAGVIFTAFPANAVTIVGVTVLFVVAIGGLALTWRLGS